MTEMRILTVRQPWAWAIIHGGKDVENRVRNIAGSYRGPIAIHAALSQGTKWEFAAAWADVESLSGQRWPADQNVLGAIIGLVDLVDVAVPPVFSTSRWAEEGAHHLVLKNPRPLTEPIPFKGALGLRRLDEKTIAQIKAQLESES